MIDWNNYYGKGERHDTICKNADTFSLTVASNYTSNTSTDCINIRNTAISVDKLLQVKN